MAFELRRKLTASTDDAANIRWAYEARADMQRYGSGRMYRNFPGHGGWRSCPLTAFGGEAYAHLAKVTRAYDPENLLRMNQNVRPA